MRRSVRGYARGRRRRRKQERRLARMKRTGNEIVWFSRRCGEPAVPSAPTFRNISCIALAVHSIRAKPQQLRLRILGRSERKPAAVPLLASPPRSRIKTVYKPRSQNYISSLQKSPQENRTTAATTRYRAIRPVNPSDLVRNLGRRSCWKWKLKVRFFLSLRQYSPQKHERRKMPQTAHNHSDDKSGSLEKLTHL